MNLERKGGWDNDLGVIWGVIFSFFIHFILLNMHMLYMYACTCICLPLYLLMYIYGFIDVCLYLGIVFKNEHV